MTEYRKVSRHCLLPVLPFPGTYVQHFKVQGEEEWGPQLKWISEFSDKLSDYVVVTQNDPALVERIEKVTGKRVIPTLCLVDDTSLTACSKTINPFAFNASPRQREWIGYLQSRLDHWPWIMAANSENGMDCNQGSWKLIQHLQEFVRVFPDMGNKFAYAPWDVALAGEAGTYANRLDQCEVLQHFLNHKALVCVYMGYQVLYRNLAEYTADGYNLDGTVWLHAINRGDRNWIRLDDPRTCFPYENISKFYKALGEAWRAANQVQAPIEQTSYYAQVRREACAFSGIGFYTGAARHNLARMVDFGFTGCCFFPPADGGDEGRKQMELYTTDVL